MKRLLAAALFAALMIPAVAQQEAPGEKSDKPGTDAAATGTENAYLLDVSKARAKRGRVPNGYGKLGLTRDQRERIYGIQAAYSDRIKELEAEIEQLKSEEKLRIKDVLTDVQKAQVERYEAQRTARRNGDS